ncbi:polyphosphate kinase 1 [Muricauda sp. 334s03]|uniref:Polyphosphate kinase n=2 Tax=Flagellimonas TaxID=444459 RepID=A0ABT5XNF8_9FLAO|nr:MULTISPECIES: polyphosphate kinase 1 [Allomuricauda]MDF0707425.1 polyphosphate kinase 1 [[Muricauda] okinawensis]MDF0715327.1 polyphosphate kinase 1 [[Muricauda] yonaguniensis]
MEKLWLESGFRYNNRDVDWLNFNQRVLQEAKDTSNPILERVKFLAIFSSNLDEFFKVRVSKLRQIGKVDKSMRSPLGIKPKKTLRHILERVHFLQEEFGRIYRDSILPELNKNNIQILEISEYDDAHRSYLNLLFKEEIKPGLNLLKGTDLKIDNFMDGQLYLAILLDKPTKLAFVSVDKQKWDRFIKIPSKDGIVSYAFFEDVLKLNASFFFPNKSILGMYNIKVSRDAELYLDDDYQGEWIQRIYDALQKRQDGQPTRLLFEGSMPKHVQHLLEEQLGLDKIDLVKGGGHHNFSDFFNFTAYYGNRKEFFNDPMPPIVHRAFEDSDDYFQLIADKDRILHFPYQSFSYVEKWLQQAATDPNVHSIQISLYRIAKDSELTSALLKAIRNGKEVTVFVEAKARFDEENNIGWGQVFEKEGGTVFYSFPNVKVHSKILLIKRRENGKSKAYAYIGTGNFNAKTARIYCDHGLFTAHSGITNDLDQVFLVLKRKVLVPKLNHLLASPYNSRLTFEHLVLKEIENALNGFPAGITLKMNSLEDKNMIDWLYRASKAGVRVHLLVRGFCCLVPEVPNLSENIVVRSIVDRFLEHGRVFLFHNAGDEKMFMGSADWMPRNLDRRIEVITPILDSNVFNELKQILALQFSDNVKARRVAPGDNMNLYHPIKKGERPIRSQYAIYDYLADAMLE